MAGRSLPARVALAALLLSATLPSIQADHVREESELFVAPSLTGLGNTHTRCVADANAGDVCFEVLAHEVSADIRVETPAGQPVAALARLFDGDFVFAGWSGAFCGDMDNLRVAGATYLVVQPLDPVNADVACDDTGLPLVGTVTAGFH